MANFNDVNVTADLRRVFEEAALISSGFDDVKIRSAYVVMALMNSNNTVLNNFTMEYGISRISSTSIVKLFSTSPEFFAEIFGEEASKDFFDIEEFTEEEEEEPKTKFSFFKSKKKIEEADIDEAVERYLEKLQEQLDEEEFESDFSVEYSDKLEECLDDAAKRCINAEVTVLDADNVWYSLLKKEDTSAYKLMNFILPKFFQDATVESFLEYIEQNANIYLDTSEKNSTVNIPSSLTSCCENFNQKFTKGEKSDILGRDKEKKQLWNIFSKKTKSNAILVGGPGVGKTAIIEAITQDIVNEDCPKRFIGYSVISFDIEASVAGTKYRGEFEAKVAMLKKFIEQTKKVILFIDEIHRTLGVGAVEGSSNDLSGALKSTLARDDVIVVGTTTTEEYRRFISSDGAFKRRFETVMVKEPKRADVKLMVKRKIETLEKFHGVKLEEDLLEYIITASSCFNSNSSNPDRTLDLADRTMAIAENVGDMVVTKEHIKKVFEDAYEKLYSMDKKVKEIIAYHETAHYVVSRVTKTYEEYEMIAVSIVPTNESLGVNIPELKEDIVLKDRAAFIADICLRLAGRVIEKMKFNNVDSGAASDLKIATSIAKELVMCYGMDNEFGNISFVYDDEQIMGNSEKYENQINKKVIEILKEATEKTKVILKDNMEFVDLVANALIEKSLLTKEDLDLLYEQYLSTK